MTQEKPSPEEEAAELAALRKNPVVHTRIDNDKLATREGGGDFLGNLAEFETQFEWRWIDAETKLLHDKKLGSKGDPFTGLIHIKDNKLDKKTYTNQEQKINFEEGKVKFINSRPTEQ